MQIALLEFQSKFAHKTSNYHCASSLALESIAKISNLCTSVPQSDRKKASATEISTNHKTAL